MYLIASVPEDPLNPASCSTPAKQIGHKGLDCGPIKRTGRVGVTRRDFCDLNRLVGEHVVEVDNVALGLVKGGQVDVNIVGVKEALTIAGGVEVWQLA